MLAIEVVFLTGRYVATVHDDRATAEWPPHPARLFSAMVSEWGSAETADPAEREVLEALECFDPPEICASGADHRAPVTHYVPVNDPSIFGDRQWGRAERLADAIAVLDAPNSTDRQRATATKAIAKQRDVATMGARASIKWSPMPGNRGHQARMYPSVTPYAPSVRFVWPDAVLDDHQRLTLDRLLERVTRLGHSSSLVACRVVDELAFPTTMVPASSGEVRLRTVEPGQLRALEHEFARHRGSRPRSLPARMTNYAFVDDLPANVPKATRSELAGRWITFEVTAPNGRRPSGRLASALTYALRGALVRYTPQQDAVLHGHEPDGTPTRDPHVAFVALPDVGHGHARGEILGLAVLFPTDLDWRSPRARLVLRAIGAWEDHSAGTRDEGEANGSLFLSGGRRYRCVRTSESPLRTLQRTTWERAATRWVSATPLALPWRARTAEQRANEWSLAEGWVADSCEHVGLPRPRSVDVSLNPLLAGTAPAGRYPAFRQGSTARRLVHARVEFDEPVAGPLVIGSGRYLGLGLMRPERPE